MNTIYSSNPSYHSSKPMHMQPIYRTHPFITVEGNGRGRTNAYIKGSGIDVGADIFRRGLCLPSDNKMTEEQQDRIIEIMKAGARSAEAILKLMDGEDVDEQEISDGAIYSRFDQSVCITEGKGQIKGIIFDLDDTLYSEKEYVKSGYKAVSDVKHGKIK